MPGIFIIDNQMPPFFEFNIYFIFVTVFNPWYNRILKNTLEIVF
jgi:hypothetical protein